MPGEHKRLLARVVRGAFEDVIPRFHMWPPTRHIEKSKMDSALLRNLVTGAGSSSQFIGGLIIALLYGVVGFLGAIGSILIFRRMFTGRWEQIFWASFLVVIAGFYLSFAAYFQTSIDAWHTELAGVTFFLICAVAGLYSRPILATGYVLHGLWDLFHGLAGTSLGGQSMTQIPLGYEVFCATYDSTVASYLVIGDTVFFSKITYWSNEST